MSVYRKLRGLNQALWGKVVTNTFVEEMGVDMLSLEKFHRYPFEGHVFVRHFTRLLAPAEAKGPYFSMATPRGLPRGRA